jgi:CheY-like chemotaxis protein
MMGDREKSMESGRNGYIEKPIQPKTFMAQVERYFDRKNGSIS